MESDTLDSAINKGKKKKCYKPLEKSYFDLPWPQQCAAVTYCVAYV